MKILRSSIVLIGALVAFSLGTSTIALSADGGRSVYTKIDIEKNCRLGRQYEQGQGAEWWCPGLGDMEILVAEGDLRFFLGYGPNAHNQRSFEQTLGPFNVIGKTLEWRVTTVGGKQTPYATILRYHTDFNGKKGQTLVVTKIGPTDACHIAYVNASVNANANVMARVAADTLSADFDCARDTARKIGK